MPADSTAPEYDIKLKIRLSQSMYIHIHSSNNRTKFYSDPI